MTYNEDIKQIAVEKGRKIWPANSSDSDLEHATRWIFFQVAEGMKFMHSDMSICHRDLKHENILLGKQSPDPYTEEEAQPTIKVCDFTTAVCMSTPTNECKLVEKGGTIPFNAPEVFSSSEFLAMPVDVWAFGLSMIVYLTCRLPFDHREEDIEKAIKDCDYSAAVDNIQGVSDNLKNILKLTLDKDPKSRPSFEFILNHPWF